MSYNSQQKCACLIWCFPPTIKRTLNSLYTGMFADFVLNSCIVYSTLFQLLNFNLIWLLSMRTISLVFLSVFFSRFVFSIICFQKKEHLCVAAQK